MDGDTTEIQVIHQDDETDRQYRAIKSAGIAREREDIPAHVWVGIFHNQSVRGGVGFGAQTEGVHVIAYARRLSGRGQVWETLVTGTTRYEPETRNVGGGTGAYVPVPPSQERIDAAVATATAALKRASTRE